MGLLDFGDVVWGVFWDLGCFRGFDFGYLVGVWNLIVEKFWEILCGGV